jgi:hypothetical protein
MRLGLTEPPKNFLPNQMWPVAYTMLATYLAIYVPLLS